jgi:hypothetical protein
VRKKASYRTAYMVGQLLCKKMGGNVFVYAYICLKNSRRIKNNTNKLGAMDLLTPVILATQEAETRRIIV